MAVGFEIGVPPPLETKESGTATVTARAVEGEGTFSSSSSSSYSAAPPGLCPTVGTGGVFAN